MTVKTTSLRARSLVALFALGATLIVTALPQIAFAAPTPSGPAFPAPGGSTVTNSPTDGSFIGKTGGSTATYAGFTGVFTHLWWGADQISGPNPLYPAVALDNAIDNAAEHLGLASTSGNTTIWGPGASNLKYISSGAYTTVSVATRFRMVVTRASDNSAISFVTAATAGVASNVGAVVPVPLSGGVGQSFKVMRIFEACRAGLTTPAGTCGITDANWEPINTLYDRLQTDPAVSTRSSWNGGFYWNRAPSALALSPSTNEDTAVGISLVGTDPDGNSLTYTVVSGPTNGALTGSGASRTYTPNLNANGPDSFTYKVNDGFADSATVTVSITVNPVNDIPVALAQAVSVNEDGTRAIELTGTDVETPTLTYEVVIPPAGALDTSTLPIVTYAPATNFNGSDSFRFRAFDGTAYSPLATVTITVNPVNDAPVASDSLTGTPEDVALDFAVTASDVDLDALTYTIVDVPEHGTLTGSGPNYHFVPELNYSGFDAFTFTVNDGVLGSNLARVTIEIPPVNDAPIAIDDALTTDEDTALDLTLGASDVDNINDQLTYEILSGPSSGTLTGSGANRQYVPGLNFNGSDTITFRANDGEFDSNVGTISITVAAVNDAPGADDLSLPTAEDTTLDITLTGSDLDGDAITFAVLNGPDHGTLTGDAPNLVYVPDANYFGGDSFTFITNDAALDSPVATVSIDVTPVNDVPIADGQTISTAEDTALAITLSGSDIEGSTLTFAVVDGPTNGLLTGSGGELIYTPFTNFNGSDSFVVIVSDGELDSAPATISIEVGSVNDAPVALEDTASTGQYTPVTFDVLGNDSDVDLDAITVTSASDGGAGSTTVNPDGTITYAPTPEFKGGDAFTYTIDDGAGGTAVGSVSIIEIGCGEDGVDHLAGGPGEGSASRTIDRDVEPVVGGLDPDTAANVHAYNCAYVVTTEDTLDDALGG